MQPLASDTGGVDPHEHILPDAAPKDLPADLGDLLRRAFDEAPIGKDLATLPEGRLIRVNRALCELLGLPEEELLGLTWKDLTHPDDLAADLALWERLTSGEIASYDLEKRYLRRDGSVVWARVCVAVVRDAQGELRYAVDQVQDTTDRKRAELALGASEERYRNLVEGIPVGVYRTTPGGEVLEANRALVEMLGFPSREALLAMNARDVYAEPTARDRWSEAMGRDGMVRDFEIPLRRWDGTVIWARDNGRAVSDDTGRVAYCEGTLQDVTARRRAEGMLAGQARILEAIARRRSLRETLESLCALVESQAPGTRCSVLLVEGSTLRTAAAPSLPAEYNRAVDGIEVGPKAGSCGTAAHLGEPVVVADIASDPLWEDFWDLALPHGLRACWSIPVIASDGTVLGTFAVYYDRPTEPLPEHWELIEVAKHLAAVAIEADRSDAALREALQDLEAHVASKDRFLAAVSHEVRTPLTAVVGFAQELLEGADGFDREELLELIAVIADQSTEVASIVEDLLVAARADLEELSVAPERVDLAAQVETVVSGWDDPQRAQVEMDGRAAAWADPIRVRQIVRNLLTNALRYGGDRIVVHLEEDSARSRFEVLDDGPGIPEDVWERIFEPYYRAHEGPKFSPTGIGLGLYVARSLARLMGGDLTCERTDGWTSFQLSLPSGPGNDPDV